MTIPTDTNCACPDCKCQVSEGHHVIRDDKDYCSEACASGHVNGGGCCDGACDCSG